MALAKVDTISKEGTLSLVKWAAVLGIASLVPLFPLQQVTGPIINALLFIAVVILGLRQTMAVCFVPSLMALSAGLLPIFLAPIVPFIIISNIILVVVFNYVRETNFWLGIVVASLVKFVFIWSTTTLVASMFIKNPIAIKAVATMMSWPQLITALIGGVIAFVFLKSIKKI